MVDPNTRTGKRTPVTLKIKFKSETLEQFIERYAVDVSQGGIFIRTKEPLAVGTQMRFEFQLRDASPLIGGEGTVVWTRENDPSRPAIAPGMGVRFDRLAEGSQSVLERILAEKVKQAPQRTAEQTTKPPLFTDTPTRVAPAPVQDALLNAEKPRRPAPDSNPYNDQHTPLPKPMPFHSDADEFPDEAFEEATKVRALDELIAQTADGAMVPAAGSPADELAARRGNRVDATLPDPAPGGVHGVPKSVLDRDSAPGLPSPPESAAKSPRLLDTTPSPRTEGDVLPVVGAKTKLGLEAPRLPHMSGGGPSGPTMGQVSLKDAPTRPSGMRAVASESTTSTRMPAPRAPSKAPLVILALVLAAAAGAGVWFFVLREKAVEDAGGGGGGGGGVADPGPGSGKIGSAGSAIAGTNPGSNGSAEAPDVPKAVVVDTVIEASVAGATVEIVGTKQSGPAPFTAKLEKAKDYKARVIAPGFATLELDVTGGQDKIAAKLVAKPRVLSINTSPPGALIFVDSGATGHTTPYDVELTKAQAAKKNIRVVLRKGGYKQIDRLVSADSFTEDAAKMVAKLDESMTVQVYRPPPPDRGSNNPPAGSNTPPVGSGSDGPGSAATPSGSGTPPAGTGSGATPSGSGATPTPPAAGSGSAAGIKAGSGNEPEPEFVKKP